MVAMLDFPWQGYPYHLTPKKIENKHAKEKDLGLRVFHHTSNYKLNVNLNTDFSAACRTPQHLYQTQQYFHSNWEVSTEVKVRG